MTIKPYKIGSTSVLPIPASFQLSAQNYDAYQGRDGVLIFTPQHLNPFLNAHFVATHDFSQLEDIHLTPADGPF